LKLEKLVKEQTLNSTFLPTIGANQTLLTEKKTASGPASFRADRPVLIVSSTSWTPDEDFQILLDAAKQYDDLAKLENSVKAGSVYRKLLFVITGKGPLKQHYEEVISKMALENVAFITTWLSPEDYPLLLGMFPCVDYDTAAAAGDDEDDDEGAFLSVFVFPFFVFFLMWANKVFVPLLIRFACLDPGTGSFGDRELRVPS